MPENVPNIEFCTIYSWAFGALGGLRPQAWEALLPFQRFLSFTEIMSVMSKVLLALICPLSTQISSLNEISLESFQVAFWISSWQQKWILTSERLPHHWLSALRKGKIFIYFNKLVKNLNKNLSDLLYRLCRKWWNPIYRQMKYIHSCGATYRRTSSVYSTHWVAVLTTSSYFSIISVMSWQLSMVKVSIGHTDGHPVYTASSGPQYRWCVPDSPSYLSSHDNSA